MSIQFRHGQLAALLTIFGNLGADQDLVTDAQIGLIYFGLFTSMRIAWIYNAKVFA
jgi:hypothetical protein